MDAKNSELAGAFDRASEMIESAGALLIGAGAGMGVDSGLPDFRGNQGFWNAYPAFRDLGLRFVDLASPHWFDTDPSRAWGFYGHRLSLYRRTHPHGGFTVLSKLAEKMPGGVFVYTSNVDGHFQKSGFSDHQIVEFHGSIHHLQCAKACTDTIWSADSEEISVDEATCRAVGEMPRCPRCRGVARPNILMFGDGRWIGRRTASQELRYEAWLNETLHKHELVKIEFGAGTAIVSVRDTLERLPGSLIRVNPRECIVPTGAVGIRTGASEALEQIAKRLL